MRLVFVGQPNCGKSTIFNYLVGYRAVSANFPGSTVKYTSGKLRLGGREFECVDLPGTYSLSGFDPAEKEVRRYLLEEDYDVILNVVDASLLGRGLELTLELLELEKPMVLILNMIDEAERKGISIDGKRLSGILGIPVVKTIGHRGIGLTEVINQAIRAKEEGLKGNLLPFSRDVEGVIRRAMEHLSFSERTKGLPLRFLAIKVLERDEGFTEEAPFLEQLRQLLELRHGKPSDVVISSERHALTMALYEQVAKVIHPPRMSFRDKLDGWVMHPVFGYVFLAFTFLGLFYGVFVIGGRIEELLVERLGEISRGVFDLQARGALGAVLQGALEGLMAGIGIVLPYLVPFLFALAFLEDSGYLPRIAFLVDSFMHKIGLHGKSVLPFLMGYGCSVPAVMATRILESERDRVITAVLSTFIPCSARTVVILALVSFTMGPLYALLIYLGNLFVVGFLGRILASFYKEVSPGLILEVPRYQVPNLRMLVLKTWLRLKEFILMAWPLLVLGSAILGLLHFFNLDQTLNRGFRVVTSPLGLPEAAGVPLLFGILRKEAALVMLYQALGTKDLLGALGREGILVFAAFVTFFVPCVATLGVLTKEIGLKRTLGVGILALLLAFVLGLLARFISQWLFV